MDFADIIDELVHVGRACRRFDGSVKAAAAATGMGESSLREAAAVGREGVFSGSLCKETFRAAFSGFHKGLDYLERCLAQSSLMKWDRSPDPLFSLAFSGVMRADTLAQPGIVSYGKLVH